MSDAQIMVVAIVGIVMLAGIIKSAIYARHGVSESAGWGCGAPSSRRARRRQSAQTQAPQTAQREDSLAELNARLDQVIDRLGVLERIVTDEDRNLRREFQDLESNPTNTRNQ